MRIDRIGTPIYESSLGATDTSSPLDKADAVSFNAPSTRRSSSSPSLEEETGDWKQRFITRTKKQESGGNYKARNPKSSATGAYQFLWGTWGNQIKAITGVSSRDEFDNSPAKQDQFMKHYVDNIVAPEVTKLKEIDPYGLSDVQLAQLIHFRGVGGAKAELKNRTLNQQHEAYNPSAASYLKYTGKYAGGGSFGYKQAGQVAGMAAPLVGSIFPSDSVGGAAVSGALGGASAGAAFGPIGMGVGAVVGGLSSLLGQSKANRDKRRARDAKYQAMFASDNHSSADVIDPELLESRYATGGEPRHAEYEVERGEVVQGNNVRLAHGKQIASDLHEVGGESHEEGGTLGTGGDRVFSDRLTVDPLTWRAVRQMGFKVNPNDTYASLALALGKEKGNIERRGKGKFGSGTKKLMLPRIEQAIETVFQGQEMGKQQELPIFAYGGKLRRFARGGTMTPEMQKVLAYQKRANAAGANLKEDGIWGKEMDAYFKGKKLQDAYSKLPNGSGLIFDDYGTYKGNPSSTPDITDDATNATRFSRRINSNMADAESALNILGDQETKQTVNRGTVGGENNPARRWYLTGEQETNPFPRGREFKGNWEVPVVPGRNQAKGDWQFFGNWETPPIPGPNEDFDPATEQYRRRNPKILYKAFGGKLPKFAMGGHLPKYDNGGGIGRNAKRWTTGVRAFGEDGEVGSLNEVTVRAKRNRVSPFAAINTQAISTRPFASLVNGLAGKVPGAPDVTKIIADGATEATPMGAPAAAKRGFELPEIEDDALITAGNVAAYLANEKNISKMRTGYNPVVTTAPRRTYTSARGIIRDAIGSASREAMNGLEGTSSQTRNANRQAIVAGSLNAMNNAMAGELQRRDNAEARYQDDVTRTNAINADTINRASAMNIHLENQQNEERINNRGAFLGAISAQRQARSQQLQDAFNTRTMAEAYSGDRGITERRIAEMTTRAEKGDKYARKYLKDMGLDLPKR